MVVLWLLLLPTVAAAADVGAWTSIEMRMPVGPESKVLPTHLRLITDTRFSSGIGLDTQQLRIGPDWEIPDVLLVALHLFASARQPEPGVFRQEFRLELEPTVEKNFGPLEVSNRHRLEHRWRGDERRWRYRTLLRLRLQPEDAVWLPFVSGEVLFDLSGWGFNETRTLLGVGRRLVKGARLDMAYMLRTRRDPGEPWSPQHLLVLTLFFAPPRMPLD